MDKELTLQYYNGSSYVDVAGLKDMSFGLSKAGFISWDRNQSNEAKDGSLFSYRISIPAAPDPDTVEVDFKGINLVFSDDYDLVDEYPSILSHLPADQTTFIRFHSAARDEIMTDLKQAGVFIQKDIDSKKQIDQWDLLDKDEVKEASKFMALSKIFKWLSDEKDDRYDVLSSKYQAEAGESLSPLISIDSNDDGKRDSDEELAPQVILVGRL
jgi:hypothetical protein